MTRYEVDSVRKLDHADYSSAWLSPYTLILKPPLPSRFFGALSVHDTKRQLPTTESPPCELIRTCHNEQS